jgi:hypothetical protein
MDTNEKGRPPAAQEVMIDDHTLHGTARVVNSDMMALTQAIRAHDPSLAQLSPEALVQVLPECLATLKIVALSRQQRPVPPRMVVFDDLREEVLR